MQKKTPAFSKKHKTSSHKSSSKKESGFNPKRSARPSPTSLPASSHNGRFWIYGHHAVEGALHNLDRKIFKFITNDEQILEQHQEILKERSIPSSLKDKNEIDLLAGSDAVHQGIAVEVAPLNHSDLSFLKDLSESNQRVLILDQVTDPQNIGAILRTAAVFGIQALIIPDRGSPQESGLIAKTACGGLDRVPLVRVTNLSRAMGELKSYGFWCVGLSEKGDKAINELNLIGKIAIVMGSEGTGLRRLTQEQCDLYAYLPTATSEFVTLNVSVATGITLYEVYKAQLKD